jgi:branched-chain amino acid transport system ATP-binding protein
MDLIRGISKNLTILIVEHDMKVVMELADRITVLHYGEVLAEGTPDEIQRNPRVMEVYLKT